MNIINAEIHRLDRVVKSLIDFSRPVELKLTSLDLRSLAAEVIALTAPEAHSEHVEIVQNLGVHPLPIRVDPDLMKQAILNVVLNGVQAMPNGGTLTLRGYATSQAAVLEIEDTGAGVSPEIRDKIFNLYFTTKPSGSGIGLALTFRALQLHNGAVELDSEPGKGATFRLMLPLLGQDQPQAVSAGADSYAIPTPEVSGAGEPVVPPTHS
jgi:signal transduction histidine kinase